VDTATLGDSREFVSKAREVSEFVQVSESVRASRVCAPFGGDWHTRVTPGAGLLHVEPCIGL